MNIKNTFYFCMSHLFCKKKYFFAAIFIVTIGIVVIFKSAGNYFFSYYSLILERERLGDIRQSISRIESDYKGIDENYFENLRGYLLKIEEVYDIGVYNISSGIFDCKYTDEEKEQICKNIYREEDLAGNAFNFITMNKTLLETISLKNLNGEAIHLKIRENGDVEIAMGIKYAEWFEIGDRLESKFEGKTYVVKEFIASDQYWTDYVITDSINPICLDDRILIPANIDDYIGEDCLLFLNYTCICHKSDENRKQREDKVNRFNKEMEKNGFFMTARTTRDWERLVIKETNELSILNLLLAVLMFITVMLIIIILSVITWVSDYHDLGVLYANGFVQKDIFRIIMLENGVKLFMSSVIVYAIICYMQANTNTIDAYNNMVYGIIVLLYSIVMLLSSIGTYNLVNCASPINLLKGED